LRLYRLHEVPSRGRLSGYRVTPNPVMAELAKPKCALYEAQWTRMGVDLEKKLAVWKAPTTLTDLMVRTAVKRRMKLCGRNYPSEQRPA